MHKKETQTKNKRRKTMKNQTEKKNPAEEEEWNKIKGGYGLYIYM